MATISDIILNSINKFIEESERIGIHLQQVILFGSYAKGNNTEWSDIDLAVVSDSFEGIRFNDNMKLSEPVIRANIDIETHPFRPEDFTSDNPYVQDILSYGIRII